MWDLFSGRKKIVSITRNEDVIVLRSETQNVLILRFWIHQVPQLVNFVTLCREAIRGIIRNVVIKKKSQTVSRLIWRAISTSISPR